jgi:hypothetical protein
MFIILLVKSILCYFFVRREYFVTEHMRRKRKLRSVNGAKYELRWEERLYGAAPTPESHHQAHINLTKKEVNTAFCASIVSVRQNSYQRWGELMKSETYRGGVLAPRNICFRFLNFDLKILDKNISAYVSTFYLLIKSFHEKRYFVCHI